MASLRLRHRLRFRITLLVMVCLLFQQIAVAAYACTLSQMPIAPAPTTSDCSDMAMPAPQLPTLCEKHCNPDASTLADAKLRHVPPSAWPALSFGPAWSLPPIAAARHYRNVPVCRSDPAPTLRFCSLLI